MAYSGIYTIFGPPGAGKTHYCTKLINQICQTVPRRNPDTAPVVVCSLTRAAAREIASRDLPIPDWQVGTLHSMAYRQLGSPPVAEANSSNFNDSYGHLAISADSDLDDATGDQLSANIDAPGNELYQQYSLYRATMFPRG